MFGRRLAYAVFAWAAISLTAWLGIQAAYAAVREFDLTLPQDGVSDRGFTDRYERMVGFVQHGGGTVESNARETGIPATANNSGDVLLVRISCPTFVGNILVYIRATDLFIIGFSNAQTLNQVFYFDNDTGSLPLLRNIPILPIPLLATYVPLPRSTQYSSMDPGSVIRYNFRFTTANVRPQLATLASFNYARSSGIGQPVFDSITVLALYIAEATRFSGVLAIMRGGSRYTMSIAAANTSPAFQLSRSLVDDISKGRWSSLSRGIYLSVSRGVPFVAQTLNNTNLPSVRSAAGPSGISVLLSSQLY